MASSGRTDAKSSIIQRAYGDLIVLSAALISLDRCRYGVDVADEAQYVAQAYVPLVGGHPFHSDSLLQQSVSLLFTPFVWVYREGVGTIAGLVLTARLAWLLIVVVAALLLQRRFRQKVDASVASLCAALLVLFVPFSIPSPSYNTLGLVFLTLGLCDTRPVTWTQLLLLGMATFCYPPFAIALAFVIAMSLAKPDSRRTALVGGVALLLAFAACVLATGSAFGWSNLQDTYQVTSNLGAFGQAAKLRLWHNQIDALLLPGWMFLGAGACLALFFVDRQLYLLSVVITGMLVLAAVDLAYPWHYLVTLVALAGLPFTLSKDAVVRREYTALSIFCGILSAWASSNGLPNAAIGCFPAFLSALLQWSNEGGVRARRDPLPQIAAVALGLWFAAAARSHIYFDDPIAELTAVVRSGPYAGLRTSDARRDFIESLGQDLTANTDGKGTVAFLHGFPAGYLMTSMTPVTRLLFMHPWNLSPIVRRVVVPKETADFPEWLIQIRHVPGNAFHGDGDDALNAAFFMSGRYRVVLERADYRVLHQVLASSAD